MAELSPAQVLEELERGQVRPVYLVVGEERFLANQVVSALRQAIVGQDGPSLNEDSFIAGEADVPSVLQAARTLPMFGDRRLVLVRSVERWENKKESLGGVSTKALDLVADFAVKPAPTSTLILVAHKLDSRRKLMTAGKREGFLVNCARPSAATLEAWIRQRADTRGHECAGRAAALLVELCGSDLSVLDDAIERVALYVGAKAPLTEDAVLTCVTSLESGNVWELVSAVASRDISRALAALATVYEPGSGPRLVGLLCWSARQMIRFGSARAAGLGPADAAKQAGVPPFKARELETQVRALGLSRAQAWLVALARVDSDLKGSSRLPARAILERALIDFCL